MKQFFKFMFASMLGTVLSGLVLFFICLAIITGMVASSMSDLQQKQKTANVKENSVLLVDLDQQIQERGSKEDLNINFGPIQAANYLGVHDVVENLEKAAKDDRIKGIYLKSTLPLAGMAHLHDIREALKEFKESGKWIMAYNELYSQKGYYMASVADEVYLFPEGAAEVKGMSSTIMFFKGALEKIGVEAQIIRGKNNKFKSAVEPFMYEKMSDANRKQMTEFIGDFWTNMKTDIAEARGLTVEQVNEIADNLTSVSAEGSLNAGLVDALIYEDEFLRKLADKVDEEDIDDINFIRINKYKNAKLPAGEEGYKRSKNEIAVIYANGEIVSGKSDETQIGSTTFAEAIRELRMDDDTKAAVLRVNSPGGSALASEVIWRELTLFAQEKPLVVSMGNLAASGGYYIATPGAKIFAGENTITGSIGVFGILPNMQELFTEKMGLSFDGVKTNQFADLGDLSRPLTDAEYAILQNQVEKTYSTFLQRVADGRDLEVSYVDGIGQGRVWSGEDALGNGLVDEIGTLQDAIEEVAAMAEISDDYRLKGYPELKDPFEKILEELNMETVRAKLITGYVKDPQLVQIMEQIQQVKEMRGVQMRMPFMVY